MNYIGGDGIETIDGDDFCLGGEVHQFCERDSNAQAGK